MLNFLGIGLILGLSAGFAPGPLLTLVISETLQYDLKAGVKVALAPIITDLPIIIFTLFILVNLSGFHSFYALLVGSKIVIALLVGKSRSFLTGNVYIYTMRFLGMALCVLAVILFCDGFRLLKFI